MLPLYDIDDGTRKCGIHQPLKPCFRICSFCGFISQHDFEFNFCDMDILFIQEKPYLSGTERAKIQVLDTLKCILEFVCLHDSRDFGHDLPDFLHNVEHKRLQLVAAVDLGSNLGFAVYVLPHQCVFPPETYGI